MSNAICSSNCQKRQGESQKGIADMQYVLVRKADRKEWNFKRLADLLDQLFTYLVLYKRMPIEDAKTIMGWFHAHNEKGTPFNFITDDYEFIIRTENS